jgi:hypothetical protein
MIRARNEAEWLAAQLPQVLLGSVTGRGRSRRHRLCAVACCRRVEHLLPDERCRQAIDVAEAYADRRATRERLSRSAAENEEALGSVVDFTTFALAAQVSAVGAVRQATDSTSRSFAVSSVAQATAALAFGQFPPEAAFSSITEDGTAFTRALAEGWQAQMVMLRDLLRNPFRPIPTGLSSLPASVLSVAQAAYHERLPSFELDPVRLCVLADALEDACCTDESMLSHLRSPGPHVRGCWALDLVLGQK